MKTNIIFIFLIAAMTVMVLIKTDYHGTVSERENKALAKFPGIQFFDKDFPLQVDSYINDRIGFKYYAMDKYKKFLPPQISDEQQALIGQDGWLYYNNLGETIADFQRINQFSEAEFANIIRIFKDISTWCAQNNIRFYFVIGPNKHNIYPEYYVKYFKQLNISSRYDVLVNKLLKNNINIIDVKPALLRAKDKMRLYHKADTHWNLNGGGIASQVIIKTLKNEYPNIRDIRNDSFIWRQENEAKGDLYKMLNLKHDLDSYSVAEFNNDVQIEIVSSEDKSEYHKNYIKKTSNVNSPRLMIIHDSFYQNMQFIESAFGDIASMWYDWAKTPLDYKDAILNFKPNILIWEMQERNIVYLMTLGK